MIKLDAEHAMIEKNNSFRAKDQLTVGAKSYTFYNLLKAEKNGLAGITKLPYCLKVLLENMLRKEDGTNIKPEGIRTFSSWVKTAHGSEEISFFPTRVMVHDVSGIPLLADLAAMRENMIALDQNPDLLNPIRPIDFIMDHSVTVEFSGQKNAAKQNMLAE